jgi:N-acetylmuramoyl-L-alanine amidase
MLKDFFRPLNPAISHLIPVVAAIVFSVLPFSVSAAPVYTVVLDPGHGGHDKGAVGHLGKKQIYEKDIALGIAIRTARYLKNPKYTKALGRPVQIIFTRQKDVSVSLEARSDLAKNSKADLFVSIHTNSETTKTVSGFETYFLNNTDKKSSNKLEEIENKTTQKYAGKKPEDLVIKSVAVDAVVDESREAATVIHKSIMEHLALVDIPPHDRGVKQALLYVLLDAERPAVLLEALFLSHKKDLAFLTEGENRDKIAEGLARGILRFLASR